MIRGVAERSVEEGELQTIDFITLLTVYLMLTFITSLESEVVRNQVLGMQYLVIITFLRLMTYESVVLLYSIILASIYEFRESSSS